MANKKINTIGAQESLDNLKHQNYHTEELLKLYPDLQIVSDGTNIDYYSTLINSEVTEFEFEKENIASYVNINFITPFKTLSINCNQCDGQIIVNSNPEKIPLYLEHEILFAAQYTWYACIYEELFKTHNFNDSIRAASQLEIITKLEELKKLNRKIDIFNMGENIKKLLPFT